MKRRITRLAVLLLTVVLLVSCTGCMDSVQLKSRTIIKMVGIDREEEQYLLTLLYFAPQAQAGEKTSSTSMQVIQTRGDSISQAFDRVKNYSGNRVFLGNTSFLVIGRQAAQELARRLDIQFIAEDVSEEFAGNHEVSPELYVTMTTGRAEKIIQVQSQRDSSFSQVKGMIRQGQKNGMLGRPALRDVINRLQSDSSEPYLPLVETAQDSSGKRLLRVAGMGIFRGGKYIVPLSLEEARGLLWATNELDRALVTVAVGDEPSSRASVELQKSKSRVRVRLQDGKPHLFLSIRTQGEVRELTFEGGAGAQLDQLTEIQNAVAGQVKAAVRHTIDKVLFENKSDVFRYSEFIRKYLPDYWKENQQRWEQVIDDCTVDISVDCIIDHPGLETSHRHP